MEFELVHLQVADDEAEDRDIRAELRALKFDSKGRFEPAATWKMPTPRSSLRMANDEVALVINSYPPTAHICSNPDKMSLFAPRKDVVLTGYGYEVHLTDDNVISANGSWGVQSFEY